MVRFDEGAGLLVLIRHRELVALAMPPDDDQAPQRPPIRCESAGRVERISFSLDHQLAAVQRSAVDLDIFDLASGSTFPLAARSSGSSGLAARHRGRILGSHWPGSEACELAVVTTAGVELYRVLRERRSLKLLRRVSQPVSWSVYSHETRLMLLAAGQQDNLLSGLQLQPRSAVRLPRFEVLLSPLQGLPLAQPLAQGQQRPRRSLQARHVSVHRVYDALYCAHIDEEARKVVLYALCRDAVLRQHVSPPPRHLLAHHPTATAAATATATAPAPAPAAHAASIPSSRSCRPTRRVRRSACATTCWSCTPSTSRPAFSHPRQR